MSDKYEQAASFIYATMRAYLAPKVILERVAAYLREQFPDPVKIEGVRELARRLQSGLREWYPTERQGDPASLDEAERLITDFIQTREAGKSCDGCRYNEGSPTKYECYECKWSELATDNFDPLPEAPKDGK